MIAAAAEHLGLVPPSCLQLPVPVPVKPFSEKLPSLGSTRTRRDRVATVTLLPGYWGGAWAAAGRANDKDLLQRA